MKTPERSTPPAIRRPNIALFGAIVVAAMTATSIDAVSALFEPQKAIFRAGDDDRPRGSVWVVNRDRGELAVFDVATGTVVKTMPVGAGAHDICISEHARKAYITAEADNTVTTVDTTTIEEVDRIPVGPLPHHIEPSHDGRTVYVTLASHSTTVGAPEYAVIDTADHSVSYTVTSTNPAARAHGPYPSLNGRTVFVAHDVGDELTGVDAKSDTIDFSVGPILRAEEVTSTWSGRWLWVSSRGDGTVKRIDLREGSIDAVAVGVQPESVMLTPSGRILAVSLRGSPATLALVDAVKLELTGTVPLAGPGTFGDLAVMTPDGRYVYATFDAGASGIGGVAVVDVRKREVVARWAYPGTGRPHGVWYSVRKARM